MFIQDFDFAQVEQTAHYVLIFNPDWEAFNQAPPQCIMCAVYNIFLYFNFLLS